VEDSRIGSKARSTLERGLLLNLGVSELHIKHHCHVSLKMYTEITYAIWHDAFSYNV